MKRLTPFFLILLCHAASATPEIKQVFGWVEPVIVDRHLGLELMAKLDTGADTSSLDARNIRRVRVGEKQYVRFSVRRPETGQLVELRQPYIRSARIKRHSGTYQRRYVVLMQVCLAGTKQSIEVNLIDREIFEYPMLLGRSALNGWAIVDPDKTETTKPECWKKPTDAEANSALLQGTGGSKEPENTGEQAPSRDSSSDTAVKAPTATDKTASADKASVGPGSGGAGSSTGKKIQPPTETERAAADKPSVPAVKAANIDAKDTDTTIAIDQPMPDTTDTGAPEETKPDLTDTGAPDNTKPDPADTSADDKTTSDLTDTGAPVKSLPDPIETDAPIQVKPEIKKEAALKINTPKAKTDDSSKDESAGVQSPGSTPADSARTHATSSQTDKHEDGPDDSMTTDAGAAKAESTVPDAGLIVDQKNKLPQKLKKSLPGTTAPQNIVPTQQAEPKSIAADDSQTAVKEQAEKTNGTALIDAQTGVAAP